VKSNAKASSARSSTGQAAGLGLLSREVDASRAFSPSVGGSGAPARSRVALLIIALFALFLAFAPLSQARVVVNGFGTQATGGLFSQGRNALGGQFASPRGVAVNGTGNGGVSAGTSYVVDSLGRVQRFASSGAWQRAWGQDTIASSVNEQQMLVRRGANGGTFTLTFKNATTAPIASMEGNQVRNALEALPTVGLGNVNVEAGNGSDVVTFTGGLAATNEPQLTGDASGLNSAGSEVTAIEVSTLADGTASTGDTGTGFEICTVAVYCKEGATSATTANGGQLNEPQGVAVNQMSGNVYVTEAGNRRLSEFDANGNFLRSFGWDVITSGQPNDTGTGFEICIVASECQQGASGANGGEFGASIGYPIIDSTGNVWVPDPTNRRIQQFDSTGNFIAAYGWNVDALGGGGELESCTSTAPGACQAGTSGSLAGQFASSNPTQIALDSTGNLYAIDSGNNRVQKFNPALTTASGFAVSILSTYTTQAPERIASAAGGTRLEIGLNNNKTANPPERQIIEIDPSAETVTDTSLVGSHLENLSGLATDESSTKLYTTTTAFASPRKVLVLGASQAAPVLQMSGVTASATTATLTGFADPKGGLLGSCKFEFSADQITWTVVQEPGCDSLDPNGGFQSLSEKVIGLIPNTTYHARLSASRPLVPSSTVTSFLQTFSTEAPPPVVTDVSSTEVGDTSARLVGTVNPEHSATGYVFEYGPTPGLGSFTAPLAIGDGSTPITLSQVVGGLSKDTTYYFRLVATNASGSTASPQRTLHTRAEPLPLPGGRAYEMVSPPDKNYTNIDNTISNWRSESAASPDGNRVGICTSALFGNPPGQMAVSSHTCAPYVSLRMPGGWQTTNPFPRFCLYNLATGETAGNYEYLSRDYSHALVKAAESPECAPPLSPAAQVAPEGNTSDFYREDLTSSPHSYDLLTPQPPAFHPTKAYGVGSDDMSHVIYSTGTNETPDAAGTFRKLFDWEELGHGNCSVVSSSYNATIGACLSLVSKDPAGNAFSTPSNLPMVATINGDHVLVGHSVSTDGNRIYFQNSVEADDAGHCLNTGCELYMREDDATTFHVSESECTLGAACGAHLESVFAWADPTGDKAFFYSCARLTNASAPGGDCGEPSVGSVPTPGKKLYRWDRNGAPGHRLIDLSTDQEPGDGEQPNVQFLIGASDDGDTAYFVTGATDGGVRNGGQIVAGASTASAFKLFRWRWNGGSPTVDYIGPYQALRGRMSGGDINGEQQNVQVTPDGRYLMIISKLPLDPAVDRDSDADVYRWEASGGWACASCQPPGAPSAGSVDLFEGGYGEDQELREPEPRITVSEDGQRIFFSTPDALVPQDVNGEAECPVSETVSLLGPVLYACEDVYEWHEGTLSLISSGTSSSPSWISDASASGSDIFFYTKDRLVGWDTDTNTDIYDARIGGGFPEPPAQPAACEAEACRGAGTAVPAGAGAGTAVFQGAGNPTPKHGKPTRHKRHRKRRQHAKPHHARAAGRDGGTGK